MPEKPDGNSNSDKALSKKGQEPAHVVKPDGLEAHDETREKSPVAESPAAQKLAETAWAPGSESQIASVQSLPAGFPQPELVSGNLILEGQVVPLGTQHPSWDLSDQEISQRAKLVKDALERRSFLGLGGPDPDIAQVIDLLEGLKLSDRRAIEMVLNREHDFRQDLQNKLSEKPTEFNKLIAMLDRPDRLDNQAMDNTQAIFYARKITESLKDFSKEGVDAAVNLLMPLSLAEKQQIEQELSKEIGAPFRDWLKRTMPVGHHTVGSSNEGVARIEAVLDQPDSATDYKGSFKVLMGGLKDNWSADKENAVLHIVSGMDGKEIRESGLFKDLTNSPYLSKSAHDALDVLLTGRDKWIHDPVQAQSLAEGALKAKNLEMFKDAMQSENARKYFRSAQGAAEIDNAFSGPFDARQKQIAHDYAELNDTKLLTDLQMYQFSLSPSKQAITERLMSASAEEKKLFQDGRNLADLRPKDTPEEKAASKYYLEVYEALRSASKYDSQQLKEWTGLLLEAKAEQRTTEDPKQQALKQIIDDNRLGVTGLDAVRHIETAFRLNPELTKTLNGNSPPDKELKAAFDASLKRIAESSVAASLGAAAWKELTDINNYNPLTAIVATPEHIKRQQEFAQGIAAGNFNKLQMQLLSKGQLSLEQKLHITGDIKLTAADLLSLQQDEKQRLLKGQYSQQVQAKLFGGKEQSEFVRGILSKQDSQLTELDQVRAFALGLDKDSQNVESLLGNMKPSQRKQLADQYFDKYHSLMNADILSHVNDPVDKAKVQQFLRHAADTTEQKLVNTQIEQTKHSGPFDSVSEIYSPDKPMANKYARAAESFYNQVKDGLTDKQKEQLDKLPAEKRQEIATLLMKHQSALKKYWSAQKDYTHNKEELAEQLADATLTAGAVIVSIAQPELSPALLARSAVLSAAGRLGIKEAIMNKDFDTSQASIEKELYKGTMTGVLNTFGGEAFTSGRFITLGKFAAVATNAAEKTIGDLGANQALKSVLKEDAAQILNSKLEHTTMDKVFGSQKGCLNNAQEIAKSIAPHANTEQLELIAKTIQQNRKQEVLNSLKGKFWHEGDQLATTITASVAGATFAEMASTAAGYESPSTLLKRLELSSQAAAAGGALFHIGFKAVGKGVEGLTVMIGKDSQGRLYAGPGTHILTSKGKELVVGKEPRYLEPDDSIVEFKRSTRPRVEAPPFFKASSMPPESDYTPGPTAKPDTSSSVLERIRSKPEKTVEKKSNPFEAFDRIPENHRKNLTSLTEDQMDTLLSVFNRGLTALTKAEDIADVKQSIAFLNLVKLIRARERQAGNRETSSIKAADTDLDTQPMVQTFDDLSISRLRVEKSPETVRQIAVALQLEERDVKHCYSMPTNELRRLANENRTSLAHSAMNIKESFARLSTFTDMVEIESLENFRNRHKGVDPAQVDILTRKSIEELQLYRTFTEAICKATKQENLKTQYNNELALIRELEAEHLSKILDANLSKRLSRTETPNLGEELRLLWQYNLRDMRHGINALLDKPTPESLNGEPKLSRIKGLPKPTGDAVAITESLASIPWKHGEILISNNRVTTINDRATRSSRTLNASGQLIETYNNVGEHRQFTYDSAKTNEITTMSYRRGSDLVTLHKDQGSYHGTTTHADGTQDFEALPNVIKIEANPDGSFTAHDKDGHITRFPDGSSELHRNGKRTVFEANLQSEEARLKSNIKEATKELSEIKPEAAAKNPELAASREALAANREQRFLKLLSEFELLVATSKMKPQEQANFYKHLNRLLEDGKDYAIKSRTGRRELAEQVLYNATHAREIDQGQNNTCNVTTVEKRCWTKYPAKMAQFAADVAEKGKFITSSGEVIDMMQFKHGTRPDIEARKSLKIQRKGDSDDVTIDNNRSWLSQMTQIAMVNTGWKQLSVLVTPKHIIKVPEIAFDKDSKLLGQIELDSLTKIYDENDVQMHRWDGIEKIYDENHKLLTITKNDLAYDSDRHILGVYDVTKINPLYDGNQKIVNRKLAPGDIVYSSAGGPEVARHTNFGDVEYGKLGKPMVSVKTKEKLKDQEILMYKKGDVREYCKTETGSIVRSPNIGVEEFSRISEEFTGFPEKDPFVIVSSKKTKSSDTRMDVSSKEDLEKTINDWQDNNMLPGIIYVHAGKSPFNFHFDPKDATALKHGWHVINAWGLKDGVVDITNQWGKKHNIKMTLEELFEAMKDPAGRTGV